MSLQQDIHGFAPGTRVHLFTVDATALGGTVFRFVPTKTGSGGSLSFGGTAYAAVPAEVTGFEWTSQGGKQPRPRLKVPAFVNVAAQAAKLYQNLVGAKISRTMTLRKYLDDGADPDATAILRSDIFWITKRVAHNRITIEWELRNATDITGRKVPQRQVLPNTCQHVYRTHDGTNFVYTNVTCPWGVSDADGGNYYDENNQATTAANDKCPKNLTGCAIRYGTNSLPATFFPGVGNIRQSS